MSLLKTFCHITYTDVEIDKVETMVQQSDYLTLFKLKILKYIFYIGIYIYITWIFDLHFYIFC